MQKNIISIFSFKTLLYLCFVVVLLASCTAKRYTYIRPPLDGIDTNFYTKKRPEYYLKPLDNLSIQFYSKNEQTKALFQLESGIGNQGNIMNNQMRKSHLSGFVLNDSGFVYIPNIGDVKLKGMTTEDATLLVQDKVNEVARDVRVEVKLTGIKVVFLGETGQGVHYFQQKEINILEALASVGGITSYGNRERVLIIRPKDQGHELHYIDVTKRDILGTEDFYLQSNDLVYVEPLKTKIVRESIRDVMFWITTFTSLSTTLLLILNLGK